MEIMTIHTPGPWKRGEVQLEDWKVSIVSKHYAIAMVDHINEDAIEPDAETLANVKLIAAAPELLKALQELAEVCDGDSQYRTQTEAAFKVIYKALYGEN